MENRKPIRFNRVDYWKETCASEEDMGAGLIKCGKQKGISYILFRATVIGNQTDFFPVL